MTRKLKLCMLGATGVGKTSLCRRFVRSIFSEVYLTTIGVTIEVAQVERRGERFELVIWDLSGEDEFQSVQLAYLRGAAGYLLVVDGTRMETLATALSVKSAAEAIVGATPAALAFNKADLVSRWEPEPRARLDDALDGVHRRMPVVETSAKTGRGVREAFERLLDEIVTTEEDLRSVS